MGKGVKFRLTISILLFVLFFAQYVITHMKRKIIIKNNIFYGVEDGLFESKLSLKELTVPAGVKSISTYAFSGCENIEVVELPDTLESIGELSFMGCRKLKQIKIPENVKDIGFGAFYECSSLKNVELPEGLEIINAATFKDCIALEKINIPPGVNEIDESAFSNCKELKEIELNDGLKNIGSEAFLDCEKLQSIEIPDSVERINSYAFKGCKKLSEIDMSKGIKYIEEGTFEGTKYYERGILEDEDGIYVGDALIKYENKGSEIRVREGTRVIASKACAELDSLRTVVLPESIIVIGDGAFASCRNLSYCEMEKTPDTVGVGAFENTYWLEHLEKDEYGCKYFKNILLEYIDGEGYVKIKEGIKYINDEIFLNSEKLEKIEISKSVEIIGKRAFSGCKNLKECIFEEESNIKKIYEEAFKECTSLKEIEIPEGTDYLGGKAFEDCESLEKVVFKEGCDIKVLNMGVFWSCTNLTEITLPSSLEKVYFAAFAHCDSLEKIRFPESIKYIDSSALEICKNLKQIYVPLSIKKDFEKERKSINFGGKHPKVIYY